MAKKRDTNLYDQLRAGGLRKSVAQAASKAATKVDGQGRAPKALRSAIDDLRGALDALESRVPGGDGGDSDRSAAARKAARTRKASAEQRSASARKAARTRARSASGTRAAASRRGSSAKRGSAGTRGGSTKGGAARTGGNKGKAGSRGAAARAGTRSTR